MNLLFQLLPRGQELQAFKYALHFLPFYCVRQRLLCVSRAFSGCHNIVCALGRAQAPGRDKKLAAFFGASNYEERAIIGDITISRCAGAVQWDRVWFRLFLCRTVSRSVSWLPPGLLDFLIAMSCFTMPVASQISTANKLCYHRLKCILGEWCRRVHVECFVRAAVCKPQAVPGRNVRVIANPWFHPAAQT